MKQKFTKRSDGRFTCSIYLGKDGSGKRKYKTLYAKTQKELQKKYNEAIALLEKGIDLAAQDETFQKWAERFIKNKQGKVSENYRKSLEYELKYLEVLNDKPIAKIKPYQLQDILDNLANREENPLSHKTLKCIKNIADNIFELAVNNRVMDFNPARAVEVPLGSGKKERTAITEEQMQWIIETPHNAQTAAMIMLFAGLRRGELLALTWSDIDLTEKTIQINKAIDFVNNKPVLKNQTKTKAGMRLVTIPDILVNYLKNLEKKSLLVCTLNGQMMTETQFRRMWQSYMCVLNEKYGDFSTDTLARKKDGTLKSRLAPGGLPQKIEYFTPHQLRHTYASLLYKAGIDVLTAKDQLGHSDVSTTLSIYTHLDSKFKKNNMTKLNNFLSDDKETKKKA
ncbi:MAG: tyrosine-type recombinase/integrase [Acutalibacteraceae bacterium]